LINDRGSDIVIDV